MDTLLEEIAKGFFRGIGYILAEIFFGTICYWVGWPICKLLTLGRYPSSNDIVYLDDSGSGGRKNNFWCAAVGLLVIVLAGMYLLGQFSNG